MVRTPSCDKNGLKKGSWTPEEDRKLIAYVTRYGCWNWRQLPRFAGLARCGKSCRLRWMNYLSPNIKRGNFTREEEEIINRLHAKLGNRWSAIAAHLPGRTDNEIKNHWHTNLKKRFQQNAVKQDKAKASKSEDNESRQERDTVPNNTDGVFEGTPPAAISQISDTGPLSPISSSSQFSSITTDHTTATSNEILVLEDDFTFLDACTEPVNGNFWTEPCLADISNAPSEIVPATCEFSPLSSESLVLENDFAFLQDAHMQAQLTIENFWTEPYVSDSDMSHVPREQLTPLVTDFEYFSLVYDADLWSQSNLYDEHVSLF